jgi:hypothetical protein
LSLKISYWWVQTKNFIGHLLWSHIDVFKQRISLVVSDDLMLMCSNKEFHWSLLMISCWCVKTKNFIGHFWWSHIDVFKQRISLVISEWWSHIDVFKQRISLVISEWWSHIDVFKQRIPVVISDYLILMFQTKNFICCRFWLYHWCVQTKNFIGRFWLYDIDVFRPHFYYHSWWIMILWYNLWIFVNVYKHFLIKLKLLDFPIFWFWVHLMKVIPETCFTH